LIENLVGDWNIDSISINYVGSFDQMEAGINSDTTILNFGTFSFPEWELHAHSLDSLNYYNHGFIEYKNDKYPVRFSYLLYNVTRKVTYSFLEQRITDQNEWITFGFDPIRGLGLIDNIEITFINDEKFHIKGLNRNMELMVITKK